MGVTEGDGGRGGGGGHAGGGAKGGVKRKFTPLPIDAGFVAGEPRETQDQRDQLEGNILRVAAMNADAGRIEVGDGGGRIAVDELKWDGAGMGLGLQIVLEKEGRV